MLEEDIVNEPPPDLGTVEQEGLEGLVPVLSWPPGRVGRWETMGEEGGGGGLSRTESSVPKAFMIIY